MNIKPIKTKIDYEHALKRIVKLFGAKPNTAEGDELEVLVTLVEAYEQKHFYIAPPDPVKLLNLGWSSLV